MRFDRAPDSLRAPLRAGLCAFFCAVAVALGFLWANGWNPTAFFRIGDRYPHPGSLPGDAIVHSAEAGYDGQFFLALAYDPALRDPRTTAALDNPRLRARRILFPALAYVLALGNAALIPWAMIAINILAVACLAAVAAHEMAPGAPWLLAVPLAFQGIWVAFLLSTADLLGVVFLLIALCLARRNQALGAGAALLLAALTREIYILHGLLLAADSALAHRRGSAATILALQVPALFWNVLVLVSVPAGTTGLGESFGVPFGGIAQSALKLLRSPWSARNAYEATCFVMLLLAAAGLTVQCARRWRSARTVALFALPLLATLLFARVAILGYFAGYSRVFLGIFFLLWFLPAGSRFSLFRTALTTASGVSSVLFVGSRMIASLGSELLFKDYL